MIKRLRKKLNFVVIVLRHGITDFESPISQSVIYLLIGVSQCTVSHFFEILLPLLVFQLLFFRCVVSAIHLNVYLVLHIQEVRNIELAGLVVFVGDEDGLLKVNVWQSNFLYPIPYLKFLFCGFLFPFLGIFVRQSINVLIL